jgi:sn-glycerol 3-phosphate transport system permease protein
VNPRRRVLAALLVLPSLVVFVAFVFYPLVRTFQLGLYRSDPFGGLGRYVGLSQYGRVLSSDGFQSSLWVTVKYTIATSVAVASLLWITLLHPSLGMVNQILDSMGRDRVDFLQSSGWALVSVSAATVWQYLGFTFVVVSAGLSSIPDELLESARVDGAGAWRRFRSVTLPLLSPTLLFAVVVLTINTFQSFGPVDLLTRGGPLGSTRVLIYDIFRTTSNDPSTAAAQAIVLFVILLVLTLVQLRVLERRVFYGD